jgi:twitching motility protein PilT
MAEDFKWDSVLGHDAQADKAPEAPAINPQDELNDILDQFREPDEPRPASDKDADNFVPEYVPRELVEPAKSTGKYQVDDVLQEPEYVQMKEDRMPVSDVHIDEILRMAVERKASDIHITSGLPPMIRLDGEVMGLPYDKLNDDITKRMMYDILNDDDLKKFEQTHELDFGYSVKGLARFRVNVYMQRNSVSAALRMIPNRIPTFDELRLPAIIRDLAKRSSGLVLVTGPTGSGKSTTIASMIDDINETRHSHIITIEDPIEYLHKHKNCMVNQREMHSDTFSFHNSLRAVLREDPDIILVGELRDLETIEAALTLAETGHLVFGTLHTRNAPSTVDRIIDVFPSDQQDQIKVLLANTIEAVVSQQLMPKLGGGRVAALEIMVGIPAIKNLIREGKTHQMYSVIETSSNVGMQTMDRSLAELVRQGMVSYEECMMRSVDKETFSRLAKNAA